jgi:hypothetical protein
MRRLQQPVPPPQTPQRQQQQQQQEQLSAQQQAALRDMVMGMMDATVNPEWRWPSFGGSDSSKNTQQPPWPLTKAHLS